MDNIVRQQYAENVGVHYNQQQKWMYLSNHMPDELLVFRQADSDGNTGMTIQSSFWVWSLGLI